MGEQEFGRSGERAAAKASTSAAGRHEGLIERAAGGTLFLDEIGDLPLPVQAKVLRVLQERTFQRVGGTAELRSDFRLIGATHRNLLEEVQEGRFRDDLYFRVAVFEIEIPPLRQRRDDIPLLCRHFAAQLAPADGLEFAPEAGELLLRYPWPGNVRELRNAIERALVAGGGGRVEARHLPARLRAWQASPRVAITPSPPVPAVAGAGVDLAALSSLNLEDLERHAIVEALRLAAGNLSKAAQLLGIGRTTLYRKLETYDLPTTPPTR